MTTDTAAAIEADPPTPIAGDTDTAAAIAADTNTTAGHCAARAAAVLYPNHAGRLKLTGADARDLLNRLSTNYIDPIGTLGSVVPTVLTSDRGRIVDLVHLAHCGDHQLLLTSPGQQDGVIAFLDKYTIMEDLEVTDITPKTAMLTLTGPAAASIRRQTSIPNGITAIPLPNADDDDSDRDDDGDANTDGSAPTYHFIAAAAAAGTAALPDTADSDDGDGNDAAASRASTCHFIAPDTASAAALAAALRRAGAVPIGAAAAETLRIIRRHPAYGAELGDAYNPLEAGLIGAIDFHKGCYIGQEVIARLDTYQKVQKRLVALRFDGAGDGISTGNDTSDGDGNGDGISAGDSDSISDGIGNRNIAGALPGARLVDDAGAPVGIITSAAALDADAAEALHLDAAAAFDVDGIDTDGAEVNAPTPAIIGLGYVRTAAAPIGTRLRLQLSTDADAVPTGVITAQITHHPLLYGGEKPARNA